MELSPQQLSAIRSQAPFLSVHACPGAGKTTILTEKLVRIASDSRRASHTAAVTFTRNAAEEMQARLIAKAGKQAEDVRVGTVHSLCMEIVRRLSGVRPEIADDDRRRKALKAAGEVTGFSPKQVEQRVTRQKATGTVTDPVVEVYQDEMQGAWDFDDILIAALKLLSENGWEKRLPWRHFLVDEAQDLNPIQAEILGKLLSAPKATLFAVGDPDQAIYGFRGVDPNIFRSLPGEQLRLDVNWRSGDVVVDRCARLASTPYRPGLGIKGRLEWYEAASTEEEIQRLVSLIQGEPRRRDVAVLTRTNSEGMRIAMALRAAGVEILDRGNILELDRYKGLAALLSVAAGPKQASLDEFLEAAGLACKYLRSRQFQREMKAAMVNGAESPWEASKGNFSKGWMTARAAWFRRFVGSVIGMAQRDKNFQVVTREAVVALSNTEWASIGRVEENELAGLLRLAERKKSLRQVARALRDVAKSKEDGVRIMTVHAAKGLEAPSVYVPFINQGSFPHSLAEDQGEERRLLFVALTRARERLAVSWTRAERSPFLQALGLPPTTRKRFLWFFHRKVKEPAGSVGQGFEDILAQRKAAAEIKKARSAKNRSRKEAKARNKQKRILKRRTLVCPWCGKHSGRKAEEFSGLHWLQCQCGCRWMVRASAFGWRKCRPPKPIQPRVTQNTPEIDEWVNQLAARIDRALAA